MQEEDTEPNKVTYLSMLKACSNTGAIVCGRFIHGQLVECGLDVDIAIGNALVDMYARCGSLEESQLVFDKLENRDIVSWGAIISGYMQNGRNLAALDCYRKMEQEGAKADKVTFLSVLKACASLGGMEQGRCIHEEIIKTGLHLDVIIGSTLVDMYAKFGSLEQSHVLFCKLRDRDLVSYSAIIGGYAQHGEGLEAIQLFEQMQMEAIKPDKVTFLNILKACGNIGAIDWGKLIHEQIFKMGLQSDVSVGNALVEMYAKCGHLEEAREVLNRLENCDVASWNSIISGYARAGNAQLAGQCLKEMQQQGITPDDTTFTNILGACSHAGLVDDAQHFIELMKEYGLMLNMCQYNCIVDLFSRAGLLNEAETLLQTMHSDFIGWKSLLTACKTYGNVVLGRRCFTEVLKLDPQDAAGYLLMSGIYSDSCMWNDAVNIEFLRHSTGAWKKPAKAWIEINNRVHEFVVRDKRHPQSEKIYAMLKKLWSQMKEAGYMPKLDLVLQPMSDEDKEDALCGHCEKLAIAFGLLSTSSHATLRITKNLRVCLDCHNATKIISKIELREIVIMDGYRLHHFKDGLCSCGDYY